MRAVLAAAILMVLAGCSAPAPRAAPADAAPMDREVALHGVVPIDWPDNCFAVACSRAPDLADGPRLYLAPNETVRGGRVVLMPSGPLPPDATVVASVTCDRGAGPGCEVLGEARGTLPLTFDLVAGSTPAGAVLGVQALLEGGGDSTFLDSARRSSEGQPSAALSATFNVRRAPEPGPVLVRAERVFEADGDLQCGLTSMVAPPDSAGWRCGFLGPYELQFAGFDGPLVAVAVEVTWTANQPDAERLRATVSCWPGFSSGQDCPEWTDLQAEGPSPMTVTSGTIWAPRDTAISVRVLPTGTGPWAGSMSLPMPFHVRVTGTVLVQPDEA